MKKTVLNIRGGHGSGKSTYARYIISNCGTHEVEIPVVLGEKLPITVCDGGRVVVLGRYDQSECGGCDRYKGGASVKKAIIYVVQRYNPDLIVYEGIIYSKTFKMASELSSLSADLGYEWKTIYVYRDYDDMVDLILKRNGGNTGRLKQVFATAQNVESVYKRLRSNGYQAVKVDVTKLPLDEMLKELEDARKKICL